MTNDDRDARLDAKIRNVAGNLNAPPPTPRAQMWDRIQAARAARGRRPVGRVRGRARWAGWVVGLAAALAVGVALGRLSAPATTPPEAALPAGSGEGGDAGSSAAYRMATAEHLNRVETFLTVFRAEASAGREPMADLEGPARQLLRRTRLLRQSTVAADDVPLRALLDDVEFVLLQIASFARGGDARELGFVEDGLKDRSVLLRLRSVLPSAPERTLAGGSL